MKVLVAGGAGFLGSHLCELFISKGDEVLCVDNLHTGSESNIADLKKNKNFKFINHRVFAPYLLAKIKFCVN
jgi:nucleoside-diphosphate-sugar epimerase